MEKAHDLMYNKVGKILGENMNQYFKDRRLSGRILLSWLKLLFILLAVWLILSGIFEVKFILYGVITCVIITTLCFPLFFMKGIHSDTTYFLIQVNLFRFLIYFIWLMKEIVKSSVSVSWNVFRGTDSLNPQIIWFQTDYDNPAARALLANSITLTPGTVTVDISEDGTYSVHALTEEAKEGLLEGTMQRKVAALFGESVDVKILDVEEVETARERTHLVKSTFDRKGAMRSL